MFPVVPIANNIVPAQPVLVATPLPDSAALRAPVSSVPPSFSNAQVNNNTRGGSGFFPAESAPAQTLSPAASANVSGRIIEQLAPNPPVSATFLAQLIGQELPPALQGTLTGVLQEYEKIIANSYTKYKPSFAALPPPAPSGVFGKLLLQEKAPVTFQPSAPESQEEPAQDFPVPRLASQPVPIPVPASVKPIRLPSQASKQPAAPVVSSTAAKSYSDSIARSNLPDAGANLLESA